MENTKTIDRMLSNFDNEGKVKGKVGFFSLFFFFFFLLYYKQREKNDFEERAFKVFILKFGFRYRFEESL